TDLPGGILAHGGIYREVLINLIVMRALSSELRKYILGLVLAAATAPFDGNLRQGCLLCPDQNSPAAWSLVRRDGSRTAVTLDAGTAVEYGKAQAAAFGVGENRVFTFDPKLAKTDIAEAKKKNKDKKTGQEDPDSDQAAAEAAEA
ncbi:MAG: hypothetical protein ACRD0Y_07170, partial [Terriglobales bacterium]